MVLLVVAGPAAAEDWRRLVDALRPGDVRGQERAVLDNLERRARETLAAVRHPQTADQADARRGPLRQLLERSLGVGNLPWPPTLRPRVVGTLRYHGYHIDKVIYESLPGVLVPAHVYVPDGGERPAPAIVFYPGHWWADSKTRPDFQAFCINMARLGFVVLSFDPFGQGERGVSARDHRRTELLLVGVAQQGFAVYETRCALEYLLSRPEVDHGRVGITGASGGGYNTWMTAALDDRIKAAVPVVGTSEFFEQIHVCRPLDWYHAAEHCHFVPGLIRYANNHELLAMAAPRPLLVVSASEDQSFPIAGVREVAAYGRRLYASYRATEKFGLIVDEAEGHGYQRTKREAAYGWFLRWLMSHGDGSPIAERPTKTQPFDSEALRCFPPGRNEPAGPGMMAAVRRLAKGLPPSPPRIDLENVLGLNRSAPPARIALTAAVAQRGLVPSEPGLDIPIFVIRPPGEIRGVVVAVDDRGKEAAASDTVVALAIARGWAVCGVDPRGIGESATDKAGWVFAVSLLLGENFVGQQAWDIGRVIEALGATRECAGKPFAIDARGEASCLAATYSIARASQPGHVPLRWYILRDGFISYRSWLERPRSMGASYRLLAEDRDRATAFDPEIPASFFPFGALRSFDLPQLLGASSAHGVVVNARDGDRELMPEEAARGLLPAHLKVIRAEGPQHLIERFVQAMIDGDELTQGPAPR
jgi:dienelactone hydrolase